LNSSYTDNDIIGIALDLDNNAVYFAKNGTFQIALEIQQVVHQKLALYIILQPNLIFIMFATTVFDTTAIVKQTSATHHSQFHQEIVMVQVLDSSNTHHPQVIYHFVPRTLQQMANVMETIQNKYKVWHDNIIANGKKRKLIGYKEVHHILPKSLGGSNDKSNLVELTAREHFLVHLLLCKFTIGKEKHKMLYSFNAMRYIKSKR
jgi:hypothetical protein